MEIVSAPWALGSCHQSTDVEQRCVSGGENLWKVPQLDSSENTGGVTPATPPALICQRNGNGSQRTGSRLVQISTDERQRGRHFSTLKGSVLSCPCPLSSLKWRWRVVLGGSVGKIANRPNVSTEFSCQPLEQSHVAVIKLCSSSFAG